MNCREVATICRANLRVNLPQLKLPIARCTAPPGRLIRNSQKKKAKKRNSLFVDRAFLTIRAARDHSASRRARKTNAHHAGGRPITSATVRFPLALYLGEPSRVAFDASRPHFCSRASSRCAGLTNHAPIGSTHRLSVLPPTWSPRRPRSTVLLVAFHLKR